MNVQFVYWQRWDDDVAPQPYFNVEPLNTTISIRALIAESKSVPEFPSYETWKSAIKSGERCKYNWYHPQNCPCGNKQKEISK